MSLGPRGAGAAPASEVRQAARRQARTLSAGMGLAFAMGISLLAMGVFIVLDYRYDQDPHRIVKVLLGAVAFGAILMQPAFGLFLLPIATPYLPWIPKLPIPGVNPLNMLLFCVFSTFALGKVMRHEPIFRRGRLGGVLGILVLVMGISVARGAAFPTGYTFRALDAIWAVVRCSMTFTVYFIALAMARGQKDRRVFAWAIVLGLVAEALTTMAYGRNGRGGRAIGTFGQANELGAFLAMFTAFSAALIAGTRRWIGKLVLLLGVAAGTFGVMLSVSRGAVLALVASLLYVGLRSSKSLTVLLVVALLTSPLWVPSYMIERLSSTQVEDEGGGDAELEGSAQLRLDTWRALMTVVKEHPLEGVGFTGLGYILPETGNALGVEVKDSSHNTFLRFLGEMGIFGLLLFLVLLWRCWKLGADGVRYARSRFDRQLAIGVGAATLAMAISCAFGDRFFSILITGNFWLACALVDDSLLDRPAATP